MKQIFALVAVALISSGFGGSLQAQTPKRAELDSEHIRQACATDRADTLRIPFVDISPEEWAFQAVMNLYYCSPVGGSIPPETIQDLSQLFPQGNSVPERPIKK